MTSPSLPISLLTASLARFTRCPSHPCPPHPTAPADIFNSIFHTAAAVALILTMILDNTIPGTPEERGLHVWQQLGDAQAEEWWHDDHMNAVRAWLLGLMCLVCLPAGVTPVLMHKCLQSAAAASGRRACWTCHLPHIYPHPGRPCCCPFLQVYGLPFDLTRKYDEAFGYKVRAFMARFKKGKK